MNMPKATNQLFTQRIIRFLGFFMGVLILYSTLQIGVEYALIKKLKHQNDIMENQQAKGKLGGIIKEKILLLDLAVQKTLLSSNKHACGIFHSQTEELAESIRTLLPVLQQGGAYIHHVDVNLNTRDSVSEKIIYSKDAPGGSGTNRRSPGKKIRNESGGIVVEVIDILPKITEIQSLLGQVMATKARLWQTDDPARIDAMEKELRVSRLQIDTLILRCREDSNKILVDTNSELARADRYTKELLEDFGVIRKYLYFFLQALIIGMFAFVFFRITRILKAARESENENHQLLLNLQEANASLEEILTHLPVGIVVVSSEKKILQVNREAEQILGYETGTAEACLAGKICHNNYCTIEENNCPIYDRKMPNVVLRERSALRKDGSVVNILKSVIPIKLNGREVLLEAFMDLSSIKAAEQAILTAKTAAESANRAKSEFLANMSHEIRTPMNAINGFSELLLRSEEDPGRRKQLAIISESAKTLLDLINQILDFSKIEAGKIRIDQKPFSLHRLLNQIAAIFAVSVREKGLALNMEISENMPEYVQGDEFRLRQVLTNLVGNAVKFTPEGRVTIRAKYQAPHFMIQIQDSGIGIPEKSTRDIFKSFEQVDNSTEREYGGSGLGLSISQSLVRLMNGRIEVESREGEGTTFTLALPLQITASPGKEKNSIQAPSVPMVLAKKLKGLVVDDNLTNLKLTVACLKQIGIPSETAENGEVALEMMRQTRYDFVLLDMQMPVLNGMETLRIMREDEALAKIPVIALTADAIAGHDKKYVDAGCRGYLSKPFHIQNLEQTIQEILPDHFTCSEPPRVEAASPPEEAHAHLPGNKEPARADILECIMRLKENCRIFDPEELQDIALKLETHSRLPNAGKLASSIRNAAESFEDTALEKIIAQLEAAIGGSQEKLKTGKRTR